MNNIDEIRYEYYRDLTVEFEAFKAGEIDFRQESSAKRWVTEYDMAQIDSGEIHKEAVPNKRPRGLGGYFFNLKREKFQDIRVREALMLLYDFEAIQRTLLYGQYKRINSYFPNSDYGAAGAPSDAEKAVLTPFSGELPRDAGARLYSSADRRQRGATAPTKGAPSACSSRPGGGSGTANWFRPRQEKQFQLELMTAYPDRNAWLCHLSRV